MQQLVIRKGKLYRLTVLPDGERTQEQARPIGKKKRRRRSKLR
jgi:hypothetical protein